MQNKKVTCGNANPKGNIQLTYKGGCLKEVNLEDSYRCVGCGGRFHLRCIQKHFKLEEGHDVSRTALKNIKKITKDRKIIDFCEEGLKPTKPLTKFKFL